MTDSNNSTGGLKPQSGKPMNECFQAAMVKARAICPRCAGDNTRKFTPYEFQYERPRNLVCNTCGFRWNNPNA